jgi:hypothetical protein
VSGPVNWAPGSGDYVERSKRRGLGESAAQDASAPSHASWTAEDRLRFEDTGVTWEPFDAESIEPSSVERSRHRFRAQLPELVWNTAALEGNNFTLPEVRTLLEGVTVGGKKLADEQQIIALSEAYSRLDELVGAGRFALSKKVSDELNRLVARHEAGGEGGALLREHFIDLVDYLKTESDPRRRALIYFASATRRQFYFDGNKRTARLMMAGELMSCGYDIVSVPYSRKLEFNNALDVLFERDDATELLRFLSTCTLPD